MIYLNWLSTKAIPDDDKRESYQKLIYELYSTDFIWSVKNDDNRASDGIRLRSIFENETGLSCSKHGNCSVLEMMLALSIECDNEFMYDPDKGDRTYIWFWDMIENLGLNYLDDWNFDYDVYYEIINRFLKRKYSSDGYGSLFYVEGIGVDMRKIEIWYQLNFWLRSQFEW